MKYGIFIQVRTGSKRLPRKAFLKIGKYSILEHIIFSLNKNRLLNKTVVATTTKIEDQSIVNFCKKKNIKYFIGNSENVLKRFYLCNKKFKFSNIVRLTADNPFVNIDYLKKLINFHINSKYDYSSTMKNLPVGMGSEIFTSKALEISYLKAKKKEQLEHANEYILQNPKKFKIKNLILSSTLKKNLNFSIDTKDDYELLKNKFKKHGYNFSKYYKGYK